MNHRTIAVGMLAAAALALTACTSDNTVDAEAKPSSAESATKPSTDASAAADAAKAAGIPPEPTGHERQALLKILASVNPAVLKDEDKAVDAARNQCSAINGGAQKLDQSASQRFTFGEVKTTEAQGKQINDLLKASGFCKS
ncbi:hypothetical protein ABZ930_10485 [Streptomyces sp. NPDC046716]|uniref:hypothetical protein n=1 Tax=Streptomyces sp. NPDC046716 TaxID=3157093 RepID=UPI0033F2DC5C